MCATCACLILTVLKIVLAAWTLLPPGIISNGMGKKVFLARQSSRGWRKWERIKFTDTWLSSQPEETPKNAELMNVCSSINRREANI